MLTSAKAESSSIGLKPPGKAGTEPFGLFARLRSRVFGLASWWSKRSLSQQFAVTASIIMLVGMLCIGAWVAREIEEHVVLSSGAIEALYTDSLLEPRVQELRHSDTLSLENQRALDALLSPRLAGKTIVSFKIWKDNTVVYSSNKELIGKSFPPIPVRQKAWSGVVTAEFNQLNSPDDVYERALKLPMLEIYAPVRETGTNRIIALAETYEIAPALEERLAIARTRSWLFVAMATLAMTVLLFSIVHRGNRTINEQGKSLRERIGQLQQLLKENETLRMSANQASQRVTEMNERHMRRLGADLHDGPVQFLGIALFRLDCLRHVLSRADAAIVEEAEKDISVIKDALSDSLEELRNTSAGLAPPEIEKLCLAGALEIVAKRHERRTGTYVRLETRDLPQHLPLPIKSCLYRFAQEGLNNAFRHANGESQEVLAVYDGRVLKVTVADRGPGISSSVTFSEFNGQGLMGLRDRVQSLGGEFTAGPRPGGGTCLTARFVIADGEHVHGSAN